MVKATHLELYGNLFKVYYNDGTSDLAYPTMGSIWLVSGGTSRSVFKWPFPSGDWTTYPMHSGLDWPYASGTDIPVIGSGTVVERYAYSGNTFPGDSSEPVWRGNCLVIDHGFIDGHQIWSLYAHMLNAPSLNVGDSVTGGQIIGKIGNTGYSDGAHLHFEIIYDGVRLTNSDGGGAERAEMWMDAHTDGSNW